MSSETFEVSFVLPCLNEAETLASCIQKAMLFLARSNIKGEVIVADNGSTDESQAIAKKSGARIIHVPERGYGAALIAGIEAASSDLIIMGDADGSYDFENVQAFVDRLRTGDELVMGTRLSSGGQVQVGAMPFLHRYLGNPVLSAIGRFLFYSPVSDFHCGLRAFRKNAIMRLNLRTTGMEFASEMVIKATLMKLRIGEVPIILYKDGRSKPPHLRTWRDGWRHLRFMLLYCPRWLFFVPGLILFLGGLILGLILLQGPLRFGSIVFDTNTILCASLCILVGFQLITFSICARIFATSEGLLPQNERLTLASRYLTLETGILAGSVVGLIGINLMVRGLSLWAQHDFGNLSHSQSLRLMIPGVVALTLGTHIVFASFFMSILALKRR